MLSRSLAVEGAKRGLETRYDTIWPDAATFHCCDDVFQITVTFNDFLYVVTTLECDLRRQRIFAVLKCILSSKIICAR